MADHDRRGGEVNMFWKNVQRRYALTDNGIRNIKKGTAWTVIVNLIVISA